MRIYKYPITVTDEQTVQMPLDAKILTVQVQHGSPQLWAIVDEEQPNLEPRTIQVIGTGNPMPKVGEYIATFQLMNGGFVGHVFEAAQPK
jgi:hypothetical protein